MSKLRLIVDTVLKDGIHNFKSKSSSASLPLQIKAANKEKRTKIGAISVVRSKEDLSTPSGVKGYVITSRETLLEDALLVSHWNPNVFNYLRYSDEKRRFLKGHEEKNLQQINTFVVDIDTKKQPYTEILTAALDHSIGVPTMVLETPKGFQVYFVLAKPLFISNQNDFRGLKVAKRISENIKRSLAKVLQGVDISCNDFGFFRMPNEQNVRWFSEEMVYDFGSLIAWSKRQDDDQGRGLFVVANEPTVQDLTQTAWFQELLKTRHVKGESGQLGRDNLMFTLALACYSAGKGNDETLDLLDEYNSSLASPLRHSEVQKIVRSAYKGRFKGAHQTYIQELLTEWASHKEVAIENPMGGWYKFKKERKDRKRSHYDEWEIDLLSYIQTVSSLEQPIHWSTQKEICEAVGMPRSTFNEVIKHSKKILIKKSGKGRAAKTGLTSVAVLLQCALSYQQTHRVLYQEALDIMRTARENKDAIREVMTEVAWFREQRSSSSSTGKKFNSS
ncbi:primase C-terminal domain-containing protein [Planococcus halocryophilus]|uniref:primase C-terminal domain-containing protein n=1 Tax=Planococcus halocryophilus TaxID=1215089 RepID=UPI001F10A97E|nr:primase C-terminal domain-containing protein [Planococcus halocryophilus]